MATIDKIIGLDLSYSCTGIAWIRPANVDTTYFDCVSTKPADFCHPIERAAHIMQEIMKEVTPNSICFIEDYAFASNKGENSLSKLGELNGLVKMAIWRRTKHHALTVSISQWKKFLCNEHQLKKDAFKLRVFQKFEADCSTNDEAAAIGIADFGFHIVASLADPFADIRRDLKKYEIGTLKKYHKNNDAILQSLATRFLS